MCGPSRTRNLGSNVPKPEMNAQGAAFLLAFTHSAVHGLRLRDQPTPTTFATRRCVNIAHIRVCFHTFSLTV